MARAPTEEELTPTPVETPLGKLAGGSTPPNGEYSEQPHTRESVTSIPSLFVDEPTGVREIGDRMLGRAKRASESGGTLAASGDDADMARLGQLVMLRLAELGAPGGGSGGSDGGGSDSPAKLMMSKVGRRLGVAILVALFGSGGVWVTFQMTVKRSEDNEAAIKAHREEPAHKKAEKEVEFIKVRIGEIQTEISGKDGEGGIKRDVAQIAKGVESLKKESQTREQLRTARELEEAKREIRELRRRRDR